MITLGDRILRLAWWRNEPEVVTCSPGDSEVIGVTSTAAERAEIVEVEIRRPLARTTIVRRASFWAGERLVERQFVRVRPMRLRTWWAAFRSWLREQP